MSIKTEATPLEKVNSFYVSWSNITQQKELTTVKGVYDNTLLTHAESRMLRSSGLLSKYSRYNHKYHFSLPTVYVGYALTLFQDDIVIDSKFDIMKLHLDVDMETGRYYETKPIVKREEEKSLFQRIKEFIKDLINGKY